MKPALIGFTFFILIAQAVNGQTTRNLGDFHRLKIYDKLQVTLVPDSTNKAEITGAKPDQLKFVNKNGTLKIKLGVSDAMQGKDTRVKLYHEDRAIEYIKVTEGAHLNSQSPLKGNKLSLKINEGGKLNLDLLLDSLQLKASSGGRVTLGGEIQKQKASINTGAQYDGKELTTEKTRVTVKAGGQADVFSKSAIRARTRAGGTINVYGNPENVDTAKLFGGSINFK